MDPLGAHAAMSATRREVLSALPDAPVQPGRQRNRAPRDGEFRRALARRLHRLADRVEPRPVCS